MAKHEETLADRDEGLIELDGTEFYVIPRADELEPFLMSLVSDSDLWCFISSSGPLTAGRRDAATALFPYETDDRLHLAAGNTGPATVIRLEDGETQQVWEPFGPCPSGGKVRRAIAKSVLGHVVLFEEVNDDLGLTMRYSWAASERFGFVRRVSLRNTGDVVRTAVVADGIVNVLPHGLVPAQYLTMSNLTNAYRRSEVVGGPAHLVLHSLEAHMIDQAMPAEALRATVTWSIGPEAGTVSQDRKALSAVRLGRPIPRDPVMVGRPGAHLITAELTLRPGEESSWCIVADVARDHCAVADLRKVFATSDDLAAEVDASLHQDATSLAGKLAAADALQETGDAGASAHHAANVLFNIKRGGVFVDGYRWKRQDFARFVQQRNRRIAGNHAAALAALPDEIDRAYALSWAKAIGDPDLVRLVLEYLPLTFSRRHGDPSRPWNEFTIVVREADGAAALHHEGNWRDIFQNWEALCLSFPEYLPSVVAVFVNGSTADGFNPYRVTRAGIEWETPDPDDPWSNIGYWGDHQIVYLLRLLEAADRMVPGAVDQFLFSELFVYGDVPYRLKGYDDLVTDPRVSIVFDEAAHGRALARTAEVGGDGKLLTDGQGDLHRVSLFEKLLVPVLSKLSNFVPGGGIWMNTQRPEWNDANNALAGYGLSMVTLCYLRRHLGWLQSRAEQHQGSTMKLSGEVADWLSEIVDVLESFGETGGGGDDRQRGAVVGRLGRAFSSYRWHLYENGLNGKRDVAVDLISTLVAAALPLLDATIRTNRRADGLYHSYNLVHFSEGGESVSIESLPEMLEGQVAVLSCGLLDPGECADVIDALYASNLYRSDQDSFMLYPDRRPPPFLDKNSIPNRLIASNPLFAELLRSGDTSVVAGDVDGMYHFNPDLRHAGDLTEALDRLGKNPRWRSLIAAHRAAALDAYEEVFRHHGFTGRSGTMYGYEGLGSIYWHMVAKLMVATQECVMEAQRSHADQAVLDRLRRSYYRIRAGLGFNKTAREYGAFPIDPYSHTPAHAGAQQPGMTGQVKEEIVTRLGELGVWFDNGQLCFDPVLLRTSEGVSESSAWTFYGVGGRLRTVELDPGSFGLTVCQVPVVVAADQSPTLVEVRRSDGSVASMEGWRLDQMTSSEIFRRSGEIDAVLIRAPRSALLTLDLQEMATHGPIAETP